ncbi:MAG: hypothetical protein Q8J74_05570 [Candidatus Didemnitutus sp.]|nr:hypothetical protein [Candidatus Didemnitutus sp.]
MKAFLSPLVRTTGLLAGAVIALAGLSAGGAEPAVATDAFPKFENYIKLSGMGASLSGSNSAYQSRTQAPKDGSFGIESFRYTRDINDETSMKFDGRALFGAEDYLAQLKFTKHDVGTIELGYKTFRTFYDGVGGFFPISKQWMSLADPDLHLDRGRFWLKATVGLPDKPALTVSYVNETRDGKKDSTIWGDSDFTGLPNNNPPFSQVRKFAPSYLKLDERREDLTATVHHTIGNTTMLVGAGVERIDNYNIRYVTRFPGEARPFPNPAATVLLPPSQVSNQVILDQADGIESSSKTAHAKVETVINDQLKARVEGSYHRVEADFSGYRSLITATPSATGLQQVRSYNVSALYGQSRHKILTGRAAVDYTPLKDLSLMLGVRYEDAEAKSNGGYDVITTTSTPRLTWSRLRQHSVSPELEVRYSGLKNVTLYFNANEKDTAGTDGNTSAYNPLTAANGTLADNRLSEDHGNFTFGANWRQSSLLLVRAEVFQKSHSFESIGIGVRPDVYILDNEYQGVKATVVVKPVPALSFTTRYVYRTGEIEVTGRQPLFPTYESGDIENHSISETIDWTPNAQSYAQLNGTIVFNTIQTIYPRAGVVPASGTNVAYDANKIVQNSNNNYVTMSFLYGVVLNAATDLQTQVTYYRADNDDSALASMTMPYGVMARDYMFTVGIKRKLSEKMVLNAKAGYRDSQNDTTGGNTNFKGPIAYVSFDYAL